jgi:YHS domain-containing protein
MTSRTSFVAALVAAGSLWLPVAGAQHQEHQPAATQSQASAETVQCAQAQPVIARTVDAAMARLEASRQANSPAQMRAAIDDLQGALRDMRAQLAPCAAMQPTTDPHAGHTMAPAKPGDPTAKRSAPASKETPTARAPAPSDPHAGHGTLGKPTGDVKDENVVDPVTGLIVDPATAPKTTYQGQTYYFSSEAARKEFLQNPAKFVRKPKG